MCQYCKPDYNCAVGSDGAICTHLDGLTYMQCPVYIWISAQLRSAESQILDFCRSPGCDLPLNFYSFKVFPEVEAPF